MKILTFNARSLLDLKRRYSFSNCVKTENDLDILCIAETWLTDDVPDESLFLKEYAIHRKDRLTDNHKSKHGGVLIAVKNLPHERVTLGNNNLDEYVAIKVTPKDVPMIICCIYNPPKQSNYRWPVEKMINLIKDLKMFAEEENCESIIVTGDINFEHTCWKTLRSQNKYEIQILEKLSHLNFQQVLNQKTQNQLDVLLTNNPNIVITNTMNNEFNKSFKSDHDAFITTLQIEKTTTIDTKHKKYAFNKVV